MSRPIRKDEFVRAYAKRSNVSVEWLSWHRRAVHCDCDEPECEGWQMVPLDETLTRSPDDGDQSRWTCRRCGSVINAYRAPDDVRWAHKCAEWNLVREELFGARRTCSYCGGSGRHEDGGEWPQPCVRCWGTGEVRNV